MHSKISLYFLCLFVFFGTLYSKETPYENSLYSLSSLICHLQELTQPANENQLLFSKEEGEKLWIKLISTYPDPAIQKAHDHYQRAYHLIESNQFQEAVPDLKYCLSSISKLWIKERAYEIDFPSILMRTKSKNEDFEKNRAIPSDIKQAMRPYIIPDHHRMKNRLDHLFFPQRVTQNEQSFLAGGFIPISIRPCSYVYVARHSFLPNYLVKAYLDTELRQKRDRPSWEWLVKRCEGAQAIRQIIAKKKMKHFVVADKWIYPLPEHPMPPQDTVHTRHFALLLVSDMHLTSTEENLKAWKNKIIKAHLDELYTIISFAGGSSYRPDNIAYTKKGKFAFIDTEYPTYRPDYKSIRKYLNTDMCNYWDQLVKKGSP